MIGVLALQGAFRAHEAALEGLGVGAVQVRTPAQLRDVDALVIPGGESTTMSKLLVTSGLLAPLRDALHDGLPVLVQSGTAWGATFHPELVTDLRVHEMFVNGVRAVPATAQTKGR